MLTLVTAHAIIETAAVVAAAKETTPNDATLPRIHVVEFLPTSLLPCLLFVLAESATDFPLLTAHYASHETFAARANDARFGSAAAKLATMDLAHAAPASVATMYGKK